MEFPKKDPKPLEPGLYQIDLFNQKPIFQTRYKGIKKFVTSWEEAFALSNINSIKDINIEFVAKFLNFEATSSVSPYVSIKRLPRSNFLQLYKDNTYTLKKFNSFKYGGSPMSNELLFKFVSDSLSLDINSSIQKNIGNIGCEHSAGLDSNAILGCIIKNLEVPPEKIFTWSREDDGEGFFLKKIRKYYGIKNVNCFKYDFSVHKPNNWRHFAQNSLEKLGFPAQILTSTRALEEFSSKNCKVLFSGYGGDQAISINANNIPNDLIRDGKYLEILNWSDNLSTGIKLIFSQLAGTYLPFFAKYKVLNSRSHYQKTNPLISCLNSNGKEKLLPFIKNKFPWQYNSYIRQREYIQRRLSEEILTVRVEEETRFANSYGIKKFYPLLNLKIINQLLIQNPYIFSNNINQKRMLALNSFRNFLPPVIHNKREIYENNDLDPWRERLFKSIKFYLSDIDHLHPFLWNFIDLSKLIYECNIVCSKKDIKLELLIKYSKSLNILFSLSNWFESLE